MSEMAVPTKDSVADLSTKEQVDTCPAAFTQLVDRKR
jgi:hypothetical protein